MSSSLSCVRRALITERWMACLLCSAAPDEESARPMDSQYAQVPPDAEQQANFEQPPWLGFMGSFSHFEDLSATSLQSPLRHESPGIDPAGKGGTMKVGDWANRKRCRTWMRDSGGPGSKFRILLLWMVTPGEMPQILIQSRTPEELKGPRGIFRALIAQNADSGNIAQAHHPVADMGVTEDSWWNFPVRCIDPSMIVLAPSSMVEGRTAERPLAGGQSQTVADIDSKSIGSTQTSTENGTAE
ncbi:hypothetical protein N7470_004424 [Penicillium chermesinum]|nr:hypothetical protein N7470_004424 [Penicillium chermesinum]